MTNDQSLLERIAQNPKCRAVQLADWLDQALEDVQASLAALIAVGDVAATSGFSPAGIACQLYDLTEAFKASKAYEPILAKSLAAQFAAFKPHLGKTDRAVEFVRERGIATSAELHAVLGLAADEYASTWLKSAITASRLVKEGKTWTLGPREQAKAAAPAPMAATFPTAAPSPAAALAQPDALASGAELGKIEKQALVVPTLAPTAAPAVQPAAAPAPAPTIAPAPAPTIEPRAPRYRYAKWSDGQVEIQRNGVQLVALPREVADEFADFVRGAA